LAKLITIGGPANESERKTFSYLRDKLPDSYSIYANIEYVNKSGLPLEYDCIITGHKCIFVVEIKDYRGEIKGNANEWVLPSNFIMRSPFPLLNKKTKIIADRLRKYSPLLEHIWVHSFILIKDARTKIRINDPQAERIVNLPNSVDYINHVESAATLKDLTLTEHKFIDDSLTSQCRPLTKNRKIGDYSILGTINANNLFTVYLATHELIPIPERFYLKAYGFDIYASPEERRKQKEGILREAKVLNSLQHHENVVKAYPPFPWGDSQIVLPYEWVNGRTLRSLLSSREVITLDDKLNIVLQISKGLLFLHNNRVIHRDVRPENIMLQANGIAKIVNLDCAKWESGNMTTIATLVGKRIDEKYTAPEVWDNARLASEKSDIYSLGIMLYELLTGSPPYERLRDYLSSGDFPSVTIRDGSVALRDLDDILSMMCSIDQNKRLGKISGLIELLEVVNGKHE
jgi:hypothetical protein